VAVGGVTGMQFGFLMISVADAVPPGGLTSLTVFTRLHDVLERSPCATCMISVSVTEAPGASVAAGKVQCDVLAALLNVQVHGGSNWGEPNLALLMSSICSGPAKAVLPLFSR